MGRFYEEFVAYHVVPNEGRMQLFLEEEGGRQIPVGRLSDGTLRYFCLLAILLDPAPPPLVAIEEPELGLHPDVIPHLAELLLEASGRMQLVVTTHSRMLGDALSGVPESIVVCSKVDGATGDERNRIVPRPGRCRHQREPAGTQYSPPAKSRRRSDSQSAAEGGRRNPLPTLEQVSAETAEGNPCPLRGATD